MENDFRPSSLVPSTRWHVTEQDSVASRHLQQTLGIPLVVASLLASRGLSNPDAAQRFLNPRLEDLHDPRLLPDYDAAVRLVLGAKERGDLIYIHGDYDVDGVTSAAILSRFLRAAGANVHTHVPHRAREGYGIHLDAVRDAQEMGAKLFLTCDCGTSAHEQVAAAHAAGMSVLITDHHSVGDTIPPAEALINPHRPDSVYPFAELSGAGVAFKLCQGLCGEIGLPLESYFKRYLDLAALGTIADVMPLVDENRIIARFGLAELPETRKVGLQALMREAKIVVEPGKPLSSYHVGFVLGPRLNAAGRIDDAAIALRLLLTTDGAEADSLAAQIESLNAARRAEQQRIIDEAVRNVEALGDLPNVLVVANPGWNAGVVGIVAGRLVEKFRRPTFVMNIDEASGVAKGSARTIANFHLSDAINANRDLFLSGGGHAMAAGCTFDASTLAVVQKALHDYAGGFLTEEDFAVTTRVDAEVAPNELTMEVVEAIQSMEPFGMGNPTPVFVARDVLISQVMPTKKPEHARMTLIAESRSISAIAFNLGETLRNVPSGTHADILFQPEINEFRGSRTVQWKVKDLADSTP